MGDPDQRRQGPLQDLIARTSAIDAFIAAQFTDMDELFIAGRVNVILGTIEDLSGDATLAGVLDLDVGNCTLGNPTAEHNTLFARRNNVAANELVVYLVRTLVGGAGNFLGCATHPDNRPGCAIVQSSARWLTAHEIGHVLGLRHISNADRLMNPNVGWTSVPPDLDDGEYTTMRDSDLTPEEPRRIPMKTLNQVRSLLGDIEPTEKTFASLDTDDIPHLVALLGEGEEWLAARAVHGLSRVDDPRAREAITRAAADPRGAIRVAVATALPRLPVPVAERLMDDLLVDHDVGVRKLTLRSIPAVVPKPDP